MSEIKSINPESLIFATIEQGAARALPKETDNDYNKFVELKADIEQRGLLNLFSVREKVIDNQVYYQVVDGNRRAFALQQLWVEKSTFIREEYKNGLPVQVKESTDVDAACSQIAGNHLICKQKPAALAKAVHRILLMSDMTVSDVANRCGLTSVWLEAILKINKLGDEVKELIDSGKITATNAIHMTKLPDTLVDADSIGRAQVMNGNDYLNWVNEQIRAYKKNKIKEPGQEDIDGTIVFNPKPHVRLKEEILGMYEQSVKRAEVEPTDYNRGMADAYKFCVCMDSKTLESDRMAFEKKLKEAEESREKRKIEREAKKKESLLDSVKSDPQLMEKLRAELK